MTGIPHQNYQAFPKQAGHLLEGVIWYIEEGRKLGGFLQAVFSNNLLLAVALANNDSVAALPDLAMWVHNHAPPACHGSSGAYLAWIAGGGLRAERETQAALAKVKEPA